MTQTRRTPMWVLAAVAVVVGLMLVASGGIRNVGQSASAWGNMSPCSGGKFSHTNAWDAFFNYRINAYEKVCEGSRLVFFGPNPHSESWLKGASTPAISFAQTSGIPASESIGIPKDGHPKLTKTYRSGGHVVKLRYNFTVRHCTGIVTQYRVCWTPSFRFYVATWGTRLCKANSDGHLTCDRRKFW